MLLSTCLLAGCGSTSQVVTENTSDATVLTSTSAENAREVLDKSVALAHSAQVHGQVSGYEGTLGDTSVLLSLDEPCKTGILKFKDATGESFGICGVKYSDELGLLCFEESTEVLSFKAEEQPEIFFVNDFSDKVCRFRVSTAEFTESWQYTDEAGFEVLDASALDNEVPFEFGKFSWEQGA